MRLLFLLLLFLVGSRVHAQTSRVSNVHPRVDGQGKIVDAHDGRVIQFEDRFYWYGTRYGNTNGFTKANTYVVYSSPDLMQWQFDGELLVDAPEGVYYRPHVIYNERTGKYVLWYNWYPKLWDGQFGVAVSDSPTGPFRIVSPDAKVSKSAIGVGDLGLFVDDDGTAYLSYNSIQNHQLVVERLDKNYTASTFETSEIIAEHVEAGSMFKQGGLYYLLTDYTCCFCNFGSGARVYTSKNPLGPYMFSSNINRYPGRALPALTDGRIMGIKPVQMEVKHELAIVRRAGQPLKEVSIYLFTGDRNGQCGQVDQPRVHPKIVVPDFDFYVNDKQITADAMSVDTLGLRNKLTFRFESSVEADLIVKIAESFPYDKLSLLEIASNPESTVEVFLQGQGIQRPPIIPAQQSYVMELSTEEGTKYIWMGDLWGSASDNIKGHDYQYWSAPLEFNKDGSIRRMRWSDGWEVELINSR